QPKLADDLRSGDRYDAACAAALAGCGQGKDADQTDEKERPRLREQALTWLRADLAAWAALLKNNPEKAAAGVRDRRQHWQQDADWAGVRDAEASPSCPRTSANSGGSSGTTPKPSASAPPRRSSRGHEGFCKPQAEQGDRLAPAGGELADSLLFSMEV